MAKILIYHDNCPDGFCAAQIACSYGGPYDRIYPYRYDQAPPVVVDSNKPPDTPYLENGDDVLVLDFSFAPEVVESWALSGIHFLIGDHHKKASDQYERRCADDSQWSFVTINIYDDGIRYEIATHGDEPSAAYFSSKRSGAGIAWAYFCPGTPEPWMVRYVQDRDLWKHELPGTKEVNAYIHTLPMEDPTIGWFGLSYNDVPEFVYEIGAAVLRTRRRYVSTMLKEAQMSWIITNKEWRVPVVNASYHCVSELLNELCQNHPFAAAYYITGDGKCKYSLRSAKDSVDVNEIAKFFGGGGHVHAAGFVVSKPVHMESLIGDMP